MRLWVRSLAPLSGLRIWLCCELQCGSQTQLDLALLWLWNRLEVAVLIWPLAWELPYAAGVALKRKNIYIITYYILLYIHIHHYICILHITIFTHMSLYVPIIQHITYTFYWWGNKSLEEVTCLGHILGKWQCGKVVIQIIVLCLVFCLFFFQFSVSPIKEQSNNVCKFPAYDSLFLISYGTTKQFKNI